MKRAIKNLCQLPDAALFKEVEIGIRHVMDAVNRLDTAAEELHGAGCPYPSRVLEYFAAEEAAKVLILVDAVRCPKNKGAEKSRTLGYFYNHIAKGIYAKVCDWRPMDLEEVRKGVNDERQEHYLDGPNDVDWIFPNSITERRESRLYVGYFCEDTGGNNHGEGYWTSPLNDDSRVSEFFSYRTPSVVELARALYQANATTSDGLSVIAGIWRNVDVRDEMRFDELERLNRRTLGVLNDRGLLAPVSNQVQATVEMRWIYPLWTLDLCMSKVEKKELLEERQRCHPDVC